MTQIASLNAREVLDSRGQPTVEVEVFCSNGAIGRAIVPAGASTGAAEAHELRDRDSARYDGLGVRKAVENVRRRIAPRIVDRDPTDQSSIDAELLSLDPSPQKSELGGNALLGVSLAVAHAGAAARKAELYEHLADLWMRIGANLPLPPGEGQGESPEHPTRIDGVPATALRPPSPQGSGAWGAPTSLRMPLPMTNMISGGLHAGGNLDFQDVLIMPEGAPDYPTALEWIVRVYRRLGELLTDSGYEGRLVGDEGGFGPRLASNREAIEFVVRAIERAGLAPGSDMTIAIDVAATHFYDGQQYRLASTSGHALGSSELIDEIDALCAAFPITSVEDPLAEEDWEGWQEITARLGNRVKLVGDDLFATNPQRLARGIDQRVANAVLIKVNQIGTLSETFQTMFAAVRAGYQRVVSARSGETEDTTIADLAVGTAAERIKIGSIVRSERLAKYNRLLRIAERVPLAVWTR